MLKRAFLIAAIVILTFSFLPIFAYGDGDTGTYRIIQYVVALTPMQDGTTRIEYYQKWYVIGGHIPWITVGVPNDDYDIVSSSLAVSNASPHNSGQESMVRLDLDRDYQQGESFEILFAINQRQLFQNSDSGYTISFTPGWYDHAVVDYLEIRLNSLCIVFAATAEPAPSYQNGNAMIWSRMMLSEGDKYPISYSFPKMYAPNAAVSKGFGRFKKKIGTYIFPVICIIIIIFRVVKRYRSGDYSGGDIFYGGGSGGSCHLRSCACACAGCACACACAGGGGAGCSRKNQHICPACKERNNADNMAAIICEDELHKHAESVK